MGTFPAFLCSFAGPDLHTVRMCAYYPLESEDGGSRVDDAQTAGDVSLDVLYRRYWAELCGYAVKTFGHGPHNRKTSRKRRSLVLQRSMTGTR